MNRQIKFRAWNKKNSQFLQNDNNGADKTIFDLWDWAEVMGTCTLFPMDDYVFQQYTGLNDSKGNPIYEGDIVINTTSDEEYCSPAVIVWGKYEFVGFALAYKCNKLEDYHAPLIHKINGVDLVEEFSLSKMGTYQIIGNASENPELLK